MPPKTLSMLTHFARYCGTVAFFAALISAHAQKVPPGFTYAISDKPDPYGLYSVTIRNVSRLDITAIHAFSTCGEGEQSDSVGSDSLLQFLFLRSKSIALNGPALIAPGRAHQMDMPSSGKRCRQAVSVLFSDGHGEGDDDPTYGWHQMISERYSSYAELQRTRSMVEGMSDSEANFSEVLLETLDARRMALNDRSLRDVPKSEVMSRSHVLDVLLVNMRDPHHMTDDLKSRESSLKLLDSWMTQLREHGYDKKPAS